MSGILTGTATGWNTTSVTLTANASTDVLSFLTWGDDGNTTNLPPMAFLARGQFTKWVGGASTEPVRPVALRCRPRRDGCDHPASARKALHFGLIGW